MWSANRNLEAVYSRARSGLGTYSAWRTAAKLSNSSPSKTYGLKPLRLMDGGFFEKEAKGWKGL
jgi:hypothetical protein